MSRWPLLSSLGAVALGVALGGCGRRQQPGPPETRRPSSLGSAPATPSAEHRPSRSPERSDWLPALAGCQISHRGIFLDLGTPGPNALRGFRTGPFRET